MEMARAQHERGQSELLCAEVTLLQQRQSEQIGGSQNNPFHKILVPLQKSRHVGAQGPGSRNRWATSGWLVVH